MVAVAVCIPSNILHYFISSYSLRICSEWQNNCVGIQFNRNTRPMVLACMLLQYNMWSMVFVHCCDDTHTYVYTGSITMS